MWTPLMANDTRHSATTSSAYLPDPRVEHYWDLWTFTSKVYTRQLRYPPNEVAWDMAVVYKPHLVWKNEPPEPTLFLDARDLNIGMKFSAEALKEELRKWVAE
ncbi:MAG TPA: hypothetical protein PLP42_12415 [Acidobacteriota bacterium]|nr:hypothetical protein [Acidobacteriota bacterium]